MNYVSTGILACSFAFASFGASAAEQVSSSSYTCAALKTLVNQQGSAIVRYDSGNSSLFELVFSRFNRAACASNSSSGQCGPFKVTTSDSASCQIGFIEVLARKEESERGRDVQPTRRPPEPPTDDIPQ